MVNFLLLMMAKVSLAHWLPLAARGKVCRKRGKAFVCLHIFPHEKALLLCSLLRRLLFLTPKCSPAKLAFMTRADAGS
jgi:hypothetical protein